MTIKIQERSDYESDINCPFCEKKVVSMNEFKVLPCSHTIFIAHDEGFEFCDERVKKNLNIPLDEDPYDHIDKYEFGIDGMTSSINIADSIKIAVYTPAPSGFGAYYGFVKN